MTFISAPRSLQGTVMGMFYLLEGAGQALFIVVALYLPTLGNNSASKWLFGCVGIGGNLVGSLLLFVANKKVGLGLANL